MTELDAELRKRAEALEAALAVERARVERSCLSTQYVALMKTEGFELSFDDTAIDAIADFAAEVNASVENIGARRLQTILERVCEEISYTASDRSGETLAIDADYVRERVGDLARNADLSKFIL